MSKYLDDFESKYFDGEVKGELCQEGCKLEAQILIHNS